MSETSHSRNESATPTIETYPPSWLDRCQDLIDRLPIPYWITYLLFGLAIFALAGLIKAFDPLVRGQPIHPIIILAVFQTSYVLSLMHFLDRLSSRAFEIVCPILRLEEATSQALKQRLTTMRPVIPPYLAILVSAFFTVLGVLFFTRTQPIERLPLSVVEDMFSRSPSGVYNFAAFTLLWVVNAIFIFHTFHQLRTISVILAQYAKINLFHQNELYAFSRVSASTAIGLVLTSPIWLLLDRGLLTLSANFSLAVLALIIFVSPMIGTHKLLRRQKDQWLKESMKKQEVLIADLFTSLDQGKHEDFHMIEKTLSGLDRMQSSIMKTSTWPWQMETVRQIIGAVSLPVTIWVIQFLLSKMLST